MHTVEEYANQLHKNTPKKTFLFSFNEQLYCCKVQVSGKMKIKKICSSTPKFIRVINKGTEENRNNHFLFETYSKSMDRYIEVLLISDDLLSSYRFKRRFLESIPGVLFTGSDKELEMFISASVYDEKDLLLSDEIGSE